MSLASYFRGKHVIVTGGSSGIGKATATRLAKLGAELTLIARRPAPLEAAARELKGSQQVHPLPLDVADDDAVAAKMAAHLSRYPADMLVNNAGIAVPGRLVEQSMDEVRRHMEINYFGMVNMTRAVVPHLIADGKGGHIANVGSILSVMGIYGYAAYAASKFAMQGFSECLRAELKPHRIRVTMLLPPDTDTPQHTAELEFMPPETKAIAGTVTMLTADTVAEALLRGMVANRFETIPGLDGRLTVVIQRLFPGLVRMVCDR
ncbi:MAG: SDR family oxidoreductase, partial [Myxococcota bacterium]